jgi:hypothetical protein
VAYALEESGSEQKTGRASRFGSKVSPSRALRRGRPTRRRLVIASTPASQVALSPETASLNAILTPQSVSLTAFEQRLQPPSR